MLHPSTKKLIDRLSEMTARGKLTWQEGEADSVVYATEGYSVALSAAPHELIITSKDGKELERATIEELAATPLESGGSYTDSIASMRAQAARIARGTETAITSLLAGIDLDGDGEPEAEAEPVEELPAEATIEDPADESTTQSMFAAAPAQSAPEEETPATDTAAEQEPDMTAAVARLADEVNTREQSSEPRLASGSLTAAATDLAVSVALAERSDGAEQVETHETDGPVEDAPEVAASLHTNPGEARSETEETPSSEAETPEPVETITTEVQDIAPPTAPETIDETPAYSSMSSETGAVLDTPSQEPEAPAFEPVETAADVTETPEAATADTSEQVAEAANTPPAYVPFGLTESTSEPAEEAPATDPVLTDEVEVASETPEPEIADETVIPFAVAATEPETEDVSAFGEPASEPLTFGETTPPVSEETADEPPMIETPAEPEPEPFAAAPETPLAATAEPETAEPIDTPPEDRVTADTPEPETPAEPAEPAITTEPEPAVEPAPARSYSLSGIGAGFGLGAMTSSVGATGGPDSSGAGAPEKIVIDATDEVPLSDVPPMAEPIASQHPETETPVMDAPEAPDSTPEPVAAEPLATEAPEVPEVPAETTEIEEEKPEEEEVSLTTPRTRFNPWS